MARTHQGFSQISARPVRNTGTDFQAKNPVYCADSPRTRLLAFAVGPTLLLVLGVTVVASAQSFSPFANKKKMQAWELPQVGAAIQGQTQTQTAAIAPQSGSAPALRGLRISSSPAASPQLQSQPQAQPPVPATITTTTRVQTQSQVQTQNRVQTQSTLQAAAIPSLTYTYGGQTPAGSAPPKIPTYQSSPRWMLGSSAAVPQSSVQPGTLAQLQRGSVNSAPSRIYQSRSNPAAPLPTQGGYGSGLAGGQTSAENGVAGGAYGNAPVQRQRTLNPSAQGGTGWGQYGSQSGGSQNQTAYDYGYGQTGANSQAQTSQGGYQQGPYDQGGYQQSPYDQSAPYPDQSRRGFFYRIGLGALTTLIRGGFRAGITVRESNGWEEIFVGDADLEIEVSAITQGGLEWGVHTQARAQYDEGRKGFTRRLPDCPPTTLGCPSIIVVATPAGLRGHTTQFYTSGSDVAKDTQIALESAHLFLRSAYGDITIGRDDGAAYLFSLGAPSLMNVGTSNSPVDYTGLDSVKTLNDASGFSEKITYTSPRLLGDQVGLGVQLGISYSLDSSACGVDYCVDLNSIQDVIAPEIQDVMEAGIGLDRILAPGVSVEGTLTYARGSEKSKLTGLDDLQSYGAGLEFKMNQWTLGGSWLSSNQGLMNGDYEAFDVGLTWQPSRLGFSLGYGHATDNLVGLSSDQILGGVSFDVNDKVRLGLGVQYADRETLRDVAGTAQLGTEKATVLFLEGGITF